ncbi:site-specific integrase [uncultured Hyphomicrobium sp.]|jgi:integrase|uniref:tyrosine-type recombinase/integrase n=1 Tax=uncultured Hyphomicrobium sp. TaxID=194373 RepID=UPI0025FFFE8A|nr:site-specific integrase [uncultured Hyphomicrobium sp.]
MAIIRGRITKSAVDNLSTGEVLYDITLLGFAVRARSKSKSYFIHKWVRGRQEFFTIGKHGSPWTADTARKRAVQLLNKYESGSNPAQEKRAEAEALTVDAAQKLFMTQHGPKLKERTRTEYQRLLDKIIVPELGSRRLNQIERSEIATLHANMASVPARANFVLSILSKLFSWAHDNGFDHREVNPCMRITKYRLSKRERYLTASEYAKLTQTIVKLEAQGRITSSSAFAIRLLMLTGARLNEILTLKWVFVRTDMKSLFLPDSKTGEKIIRLSDEALAVLKAIPKVEGNPYVITGHVTGTHLTALHKAWYLVCETAKIEGVRIHDLRHSFASMAADAGASLPMIGGLLGHSDPQTTARYVHLVDKRLHELNGTVGAAISAAMNGVSKLKKGRAKSVSGQPKPDRTRQR